MNVNLYTITKKGFIFPSYEILENGRHLYTAETRSFFQGFNIHTTLGHQVMTVRKPFSFFNTLFILERDGHEIARMKRKIKIGENDLVIEAGQDIYEVDGNFWSSEFTIIKNDEEVAKISRKAFRSKDKYGIAINEDQNPDIILGLALVIELIQKIKRSS